MKTITKNDGNAVSHHLEDNDLISYLDGELGRPEQDFARTHLEGCWNCRSRLLAVQNSIERFLRLCKQVLPPELPASDAALGQFRRRLSQHASAPVSARLSLRLGTWLRSIVPDFTLIRTYKKTVLTGAVALLIGAVLLFDPFKWNAVSADELLGRAGSYEFLNERPSGKVVRTRSRIDRINVSTKVGKYLGQIETDADSLTSALRVSVNSATGAIQARTLSDRDNPANFEQFTTDFSPAAQNYFLVQGWLPQVSVSSYQRLIAGRGLRGNDGVSANKYGSSYELHHAFAPSHPSHITEAVLTVNAQTYAPESVSVFAIEDSDQVEYRLTRTSIESIERTAEVAKLFELPPDASSKTATASHELETRPKLESPNSKLEASSVASADLEVEVLRLIHEARADLGEQISITRNSGGPVRVTGIVESDQRKNEVLRALQSVAGNPAVRIEVKTVAEAVAERRDKPTTSRPSIVEGIEVTADTFPAYQDLRARMSDEEARVFAARMVSRSHSAMRHAWALKRLMSQFSSAEVATLQPETHAKWIALIQSHARQFAEENAGLRQQLQPIFGGGSAGVSPATDSISNDAELMGATARLVSLASTNYEVVRSAFTVTRESSQFSAIKSPQFWNSMRSAEAIAQSIERVH